MRLAELLVGPAVIWVLEARHGTSIRVAKPDVSAVSIEEDVGGVDTEVRKFLQLCVGLLLAVHKARGIAESCNNTPDLLLGEALVRLELRHHHIVEGVDPVGDAHGQKGRSVIIGVVRQARQVGAEKALLNFGRRVVELAVLTHALPEGLLISLVKHAVGAGEKGDPRARVDSRLRRSDPMHVGGVDVRNVLVFRGEGLAVHFIARLAVSL